VGVIDDVDFDVVQFLDCCAAVHAVHNTSCELLAAASDIAGADIHTSFTEVLRRILGDAGSNKRAISIAQIMSEMTRQEVMYELYVRTILTSYFVVYRSKSSNGLTAYPIYVPAGEKLSIVLQKRGGCNVTSLRRTLDDWRITLTVHLDADLTLSQINEIKSWLASRIPNSVQSITTTVTGHYRGESTYLILSLPVELWVCLRQRAAYTVLGKTQGGNMML
jgi:hypothetical protein